ncbi:pilus assembly protein TadG-related protein [Sinorhizobium meliloti]|nr:pilus assembly protein TadG-related protein [Sinorhizobium meliloti]
MHGATPAFRRCLKSRTGNIGVSAALVMPLVVASMGLGIDYGYLTLQRRELQSVADLASIAAAANVSSAEETVLAHFRSNDLGFAVSTPSGLMTVDGKLLPNDVETAAKGVATIVRGRYVPDPAIDAGQRFIRGPCPPTPSRLRSRRRATSISRRCSASRRI